MQPSSNNVARQLSSIPQTHRASTLQAISSKTHDIAAKIVHLKLEAEKAKNLFDQVPANVTSRLDWIHAQVCRTT
jgi:hypothetical protein